MWLSVLRGWHATSLTDPSNGIEGRPFWPIISFAALFYHMLAAVMLYEAIYAAAAVQACFGAVCSDAVAAALSMTANWVRSTETWSLGDAE